MVSALNIISSDRSLQEHWLRRFVAILIDSFIIYAIGLLLTWLTLWAVNWTLPFVWTLFLPNYSGLLLFSYYLILESTSGGASIGKRIMGLRVISLIDDVKLKQAALRNVSKIYAPFLLLDWIVGFVTDGDPKQKWLDRVAGTTVVITSSLSDQEQHIYQTQQSKYAPPPQEPYAPTRHEAVYEYPSSTPTESKTQPAAGTSEPQPSAEAICPSCGGRMAETGKGRLKCIRCGKIQ